MRKVRLILEENGEVLSERSYALPDNIQSLDDIDEAVEAFKNEALPQIEKELFEKTQDRIVSELKKTDLES